MLNDTPFLADYQSELLESTLEKEYNLTIAEAHKRAKKQFDWEKALIEAVGEDGEKFGIL